MLSLCQWHTFGYFGYIWYMTIIPNPNAGNPGKSVTSVTPLRRPCADLRREVWVQQGWHADQHHIPGQKKREHAATQKKGRQLDLQ